MPRVPAARRRGLLLALALAAACAQPAPAPAPPPPPAPPPVAASQAGLDAGLALVDEALALRRRPEQLEEVRPTAAEAVVQLTAAQSAAPDDPRVAVALDAARALADWQALTEAGWSLSDADPEAWTQAQQAAADALLHLLDRSSGRLAQTSIVRALILLESGRGPEATSELQTALLLFPGSAELHEVLRANADRVSDAPSLATAAERAAQAHADASADCLATAGALLLAAGIQAETAADADAALAHYERAAADLLAVRAAGRARMSDWTLIRYHGDSLVNAASLHLHRAQAVLAESGLEAARPDLQAAEQQYGDALALRADDVDAHDGCAATADVYYQAGDLPSVRDAFARLAERFDDAEWWNNAAFFCRETHEYERSYAAYERCIALEPDNARYVNDTALILLYHLERDLPHAEELFRRSIELGKAACANPFIEDDARESNFSAYTDAMLNLALLMARDGRLDEAATTVDELLTLAPDRADAQQLRDQIQAARGGVPFPGSRPAAPRSP